MEQRRVAPGRQSAATTRVVRLGEEVQEVPRRLRVSRGTSWLTRAPLRTTDILARGAACRASARARPRKLSRPTRSSTAHGGSSLLTAAARARHAAGRHRTGGRSGDPVPDVLTRGLRHAGDRRRRRRGATATGRPVPRAGRRRAGRAVAADRPAAGMRDRGRGACSGALGAEVQAVVLLVVCTWRPAAAPALAGVARGDRPRHGGHPALGRARAGHGAGRGLQVLVFTPLPRWCSGWCATTRWRSARAADDETFWRRAPARPRRGCTAGRSATSACRARSARPATGCRCRACARCSGSSRCSSWLDVGDRRARSTRLQSDSAPARPSAACSSDHRTCRPRAASPGCVTLARRDRPGLGPQGLDPFLGWAIARLPRAATCNVDRRRAPFLRDRAGGRRQRRRRSTSSAARPCSGSPARRAHDPVRRSRAWPQRDGIRVQRGQLRAAWPTSTGRRRCCSSSSPGQGPRARPGRLLRRLQRDARPVPASAPTPSPATSGREREALGRRCASSLHRRRRSRGRRRCYDALGERQRRRTAGAGRRARRARGGVHRGPLAALAVGGRPQRPPERRGGLRRVHPRARRGARRAGSPTATASGPRFFWQPFRLQQARRARARRRCAAGSATDPPPWQRGRPRRALAARARVVDLGEALDGVRPPVMYDFVAHERARRARGRPARCTSALRPELLRLPQDERRVNVLGISAFYHDSAAALVRTACSSPPPRRSASRASSTTTRFPVNAIALLPAEQAASAPGGARRRRLLRQAAHARSSGSCGPTCASARPASRSFHAGHAALAAPEAVDPVPDRARACKRLGYRSARGARLHRAPREPRRQRVLPVAVRVGGRPDHRRRRRVGDEQHRASARATASSSQQQLCFPHSLGLLYSAFTYFCGFKVNSGEYKLMGLAPYGEPRYADAHPRRAASTCARTARSAWTCATSASSAALTMTNRALRRSSSAARRASPRREITQREMDLAALDPGGHRGGRAARWRATRAADRPARRLPGRRRRAQLRGQRPAAARGAVRADLDPAGGRRRRRRARRGAARLAPDHRPRRASPDGATTAWRGALPRPRLLRRRDRALPATRNGYPARRASTTDAAGPRASPSWSPTARSSGCSRAAWSSARARSAHRSIIGDPRSPTMQSIDEPEDQVPRVVPAVRAGGAGRAGRGVLRHRRRVART